MSGHLDCLDETVLYELLLEASSQQFGIQEEEKFIHYLLRRFWIAQLNGTKIQSIEPVDFPRRFMAYWLDELGLFLQPSMFLYFEQQVPFSVVTGTPLRNLYDNLLHTAEWTKNKYTSNISNRSVWELIDKEMRDELKRAKKRWGKYSKYAEVYPYYLKRSLFITINQRFEAVPCAPSVIQGFRYPDNWWKLNEEEVCERHIQAFEGFSKNTDFLLEEQLEDYLIKHLHQLEEGLRFIESQKVLPKGRVDILARDREGRLVVIECKVEKDTDILWQQWYYTKEIQREYVTDAVRFVAIMPTFYEELVEPLLENKVPTDIYRYHATPQQDELIHVSFERFGKKVNKVS